MKNLLPSFTRIHPILSFLLASALFGTSQYACGHSEADVHVPVSLVGVHHLGSDYFIYRFYVNKSIGDNVGQGGGGGSMVCCLTLPLKWTRDLKADVRWEVDHIIRAPNPAARETAEVIGIYRAEVPIEKYTELGDLYVHFFPNGRVRIVVSPITPDGEAHPIRWGDTDESGVATAGKTAKTLFTAEEVAELKHKADSARKDHGGWR
jgi:hypothetical protein